MPELMLFLVIGGGMAIGIVGGALWIDVLERRSESRSRRH